MNSQPSAPWHRRALAGSAGANPGAQGPLLRTRHSPGLVQEPQRRLQLQPGWDRVSAAGQVACHPRRTGRWHCKEPSVILALKKWENKQQNPDPASFNVNQIQKPQEKGFPLCLPFSGPETPTGQDKGVVAAPGWFQRVGTHLPGPLPWLMASPARRSPGGWRGGGRKPHAPGSLEAV